MTLLPSSVSQNEHSTYTTLAASLTTTLGAGELAACDGLGRRLAAEIRALIAALPPDRRSVRAMAAHLGVNRNLCQRAVAAAGSTQGGVDVVAQSPGFGQLLLLARASIGKGIKPLIIKSLKTAIEELADFAVKTSGSEARFRSDLRAALSVGNEPQSSTSDELTSRRLLFEHAALVAGSSAELRVGVGVMWPSPKDATTLDLSMVAAFRAHRCREGGMPLTAFFHEYREGEAASPGAAAVVGGPHQQGKPGKILLSRFCSSPLPFVSAHGSEGLEHHVVDPAAYHNNRAVDVATLHQTRGVTNPGTRPNDPNLDVLMHIALPVKRLIFDFYLHRSLAHQSIPFFGAFAIGAGISLEVRDAWYRQLPQGGRLEMLGAGLRHTPTPAWSRHAELVTHTFDQLGLDPSQAVGYRADISYPVWGMTYTIGFNFSESPAAPVR